MKLRNKRVSQLRAWPSSLKVRVAREEKMDKKDAELQKQLEEEFLAALEDYSPCVWLRLSASWLIRSPKK